MGCRYAATPFEVFQGALVPANPSLRTTLCTDLTEHPTSSAIWWHFTPSRYNRSTSRLSSSLISAPRHAASTSAFLYQFFPAPRLPFLTASDMFSCCVPHFKCFGFKHHLLSHKCMHTAPVNGSPKTHSANHLCTLILIYLPFKLYPACGYPFVSKAPCHNQQSFAFLNSTFDKTRSPG